MIQGTFSIISYQACYVRGVNEVELYSFILDILPVLLLGAVYTIIVTAASVFIGTIIGLFVGLARLSKNRLLRLPASAYVEFFRGTPLLVQIMIIYFGIPQLFHVTAHFEHP
jgi:His/Glu/Gln/Arg/opine family amino acid ABC transporter permease subunit